MSPKQFFIIMLSNKDDELRRRWVIGSAFKENYDEIFQLYEELSKHHTCQICETIYG